MARPPPRDRCRVDGGGGLIGSEMGCTPSMSIVPARLRPGASGSFTVAARCGFFPPLGRSGAVDAMGLPMDGGDVAAMALARWLGAPRIMGVVPLKPAALPVWTASGVLSVISTVATNPTNISFTLGGGNLTLTWPEDHTGWRLQAQTNGLATGLGTNWFDVIGSSVTNSVLLPVDLSSGSVFYRLIYP